MSTKQLVSPEVPDAEQDGLITISSLENDIVIRLQVWKFSHPGDTYQLLLNGELIGSTQSLPNPLPPVGAELTLTLAKEKLSDDGIYEVAYRATNVVGEVFADSPATRIRIDRTPPGAALLAPLIFNTTTCNHLTALLPGYAGMEPGDTIQTLCNGQPGPTHIVQPDELTLRPIEIVFEREVMQALAADNVAISYTVTDRAGNLSIESLPVTLSLNM